MKYSYFPGCSSSEGTGIANGIAARAISKTLEIELVELEDWNCCGSTPYSSANEVEATSVAARNFALAEKTGLDLVTPCSACYVVLNQANYRFKEYPELRTKVSEALAAGGLEYNGGVRVRHLLEVVINDVGYETVSSKVENKLEGLKVACYSGCQVVRPNVSFDNPEFPQSLDRLMECLGAEAVHFPLKSRCCGGALVISEPDIALGLIRRMLDSASAGGADCIVTPCPLCQTNLDAYQSAVNAKFGTKFNLPVFFFTQLMGLAFGLDSKSLGFGKEVVSGKKVIGQFERVKSA